MRIIEFNQIIVYKSIIIALVKSVYKFHQRNSRWASTTLSIITLSTAERTHLLLSVLLLYLLKNKFIMTIPTESEVREMFESERLMVCDRFRLIIRHFEKNDGTYFPDEQIKSTARFLVETIGRHKTEQKDLPYHFPGEEFYEKVLSARDIMLQALASFQKTDASDVPCASFVDTMLECHDDITFREDPEELKLEESVWTHDEIV